MNTSLSHQLEQLVNEDENLLAFKELKTGRYKINNIAYLLLPNIQPDFYFITRISTDMKIWNILRLPPLIITIFHLHKNKNFYIPLLTIIYVAKPSYLIIWIK